MKKRVLLFAAIALVGLSTWYCTDKINSNSDNNGYPKTLKESISVSANNLNTAVTAISQSKGYQLLTIDDHGATFKSAPAGMLSDSILLDSIKGVYEYQKLTSNQWCMFCFNKLFKKTGDDNDLMIKLPYELAMHPWKIRNVMKDTTLTNNFVIDVPKYRYVYHGFMYDYNMSAGVAVNDTSLGQFGIQASRNDSALMYNSSYTFTGDYKIAFTTTVNDTMKTSFSLMHGDSTLFKETSQIYGSGMGMGMRYHEKAYQITIGNVEIRRFSGSDSTAVYVNGTLQQNAKIEFIDTNDSTGHHSICHHSRDIQITFDDGTVTTLSALISPSLDMLKSLQGYMGNVVFATNLVDYLAWGIHTNRIN